MSSLGKVLKALTGAIDRWLDETCQNPDAVIYGEYQGLDVRLRPVMRDGRVVDWIPDPETVAAIDKGTLLEAAATPPPTLPAPPLPPPLPTPSFNPPSFNPAGIPGL